MQMRIRMSGIVKLLCKELNKRRWLMVKIRKSGCPDIGMGWSRRDLASTYVLRHLALSCPYFREMKVRSEIGDQRSEMTLL